MAGVINLVFNASTQALVGAYGKARKQIKGMNKDLDQTAMKGKKAVTQAKLLADENKRAAKNSRLLAGGVAAVAAAYATASIALQKFRRCKISQ